MKEFQELLRSAHEIAKRKGKDTNWGAFENNLRDELLKQSNVFGTTDEQIVKRATCTPKTYRIIPEVDERRSCDNCNQVYEREYSNGGKQCFGLVKDTYRDCDVIRACQKYDNGKMFLQDLSPDEAAEMATGYSAVVRTWFSFFYKRPCETCEQKESDCNVAE